MTGREAIEYVSIHCVPALLCLDECTSKSIAIMTNFIIRIFAICMVFALVLIAFLSFKFQPSIQIGDAKMRVTVA